MNNLPNLYIGTEESPLENVNAIYSLREVDLDINFSNMKDGFPQLKVTQVGMNRYQIDGIQSKDFGNVYAFIMTQGKSEGRGRGSFVDFLFFLTDNMPTDSDIPIMALEHTKNSTTESGNMPDQRSSKSIALRKFYGQSVPYIYMTESDSHKTPSAVHNLAFARIKCLGGKVLFADEGKLGYREASKATISSPQDLFLLESKKEAPRNGVANKITVSKNGSIYIQSNLYKSSGHHDPNEGYVSSTAHILSQLSPNSKLIIENHGREREFFTNKDNKLLRALKGLNVWAKLKSGEEIKISGSSSKRTQYWKICVTGEKLSTFSLEVQLRLQGWETIFTNHAGCGLSDIVPPNGAVRTMKKNGQHGQRGIPDLVMFHPATKKCLVIEGETSKNYSGKNKGVNQVRLPEFKACFEEQILPLLPKGTVCESYVCTYGARVSKKHNFFSLTPAGGVFFEKNAKPIWRITK